MKADPIHAEAAFDDPPAPQGFLARLKNFSRMIVQRGSSSLTRRIVVLNLAGLVALLVGFLYLNQFREGLIEARVQSLLTQGEIIAGAIASSATVETNTITIDPDAVNKEDVEMLQDTILAAVQDAQRKADEAMNNSMSGMLGGLKLPGM